MIFKKNGNTYIHIPFYLCVCRSWDWLWGQEQKHCPAHCCPLWPWAHHHSTHQTRSQHRQVSNNRHSAICLSSSLTIIRALAIRSTNKKGTTWWLEVVKLRINLFQPLFVFFLSPKMHPCSHTLPSMSCDDLLFLPSFFSGEAFTGCSPYTWQLSVASQIAAGSCCPQVHSCWHHFCHWNHLADISIDADCIFVQGLT